MPGNLLDLQHVDIRQGDWLGAQRMFLRMNRSNDQPQHEQQEKSAAYQITFGYHTQIALHVAPKKRRDGVGTSQIALIRPETVKEVY